MRLQRFITETEEISGAEPKEKESEKSPEQEAEEQKLKDIESIVDKVKSATSKNDLNNAVSVAAPLYKEYGNQWLMDLEKALSVDIKQETVDRFIDITKNFSEKLTHLKDK